MKLSVKFREETDDRNPLVRAKIPVTILGLPFLVGIGAGDSSDLSFSLRSNFSNGPSLSFSYRPNAAPLSVSLKSGISVFGSPHNSPLIFNASFNFFSSSNSNPNPMVPLFSLQIKPHIGDFSVFKSISSNDDSNVTQTRPMSSLNDCDSETDNGLDIAEYSLSKNISARILSGIFIAAKTSMPLAKRVVVNFRWGVSFPTEFNWKCAKTPLPALVVNKISLERVEGKQLDSKKVEKVKWNELEILNGICCWIRRELQDLQRDNRDIKHALEGIKPQHNTFSSSRGRAMEKESRGKKAMSLPPPENRGDGEEWGVLDKSFDRVSEVEIELQKAIKAAAS